MRFFYSISSLGHTRQNKLPISEFIEPNTNYRREQLCEFDIFFIRP